MTGLWAALGAQLTCCGGERKSSAATKKKDDDAKHRANETTRAEVILMLVGVACMEGLYML